MNKLFTELRRRNVFRVAGVYAVIGWLLIQVIVAVKAPLGLPAWTDTFFIVLVLAGLPLALLLAWAFEMTPEGMKRTEGVPEGESVAPKTGRKLDYAILAGIGLIAVMFVADRMMPEPFVTPPSAAPQGEGAKEAPLAASIAVLPFTDLSPAGDQEYFSDGMAEEILNVLVRVDSLKVASRTSSFGFKGQEALGIPLIAEKLNVRHVLEGSVRKSGETIRITAQLIDAQTDQHLWSETYDRTLTTENIFAIQDEIANAIVGKLGLVIEGGKDGAPAISVEADTKNLDAYELYLKGRALFIARGKENLAAAASTLENAIAIDPDFARALEVLSAVYVISSDWGLYDRDYTKMALDAADAALRLNPDLSIPYATRALANTNLLAVDASRTWEGSFKNISEAIARDPQNATVYFWRGILYSNLGYFDLAIDDMQKCFDLDPAYENCRRWMAQAYLYKGRTDEALRLFELGLEHAFFNRDLLFAAAYAASGNRGAALALLAQSYAGQPLLIQPLYRALTDPSFSNEDRQEALALLRSVSASSSDFEAGLFLGDDDWASRAFENNGTHWYRGDLRFLKPGWRKSQMRYWRLPEYWRKHGFPPQCKAIVSKDGGKDDFECD